MRSYGRGRLIAGQDDCLHLPRRVTFKHPILYMPSGASIAKTTALNPADPVTWLFDALIRAGAVVVVFDGDIGSGTYGSSWGAPQIVAHMETVRGNISSAVAAAGLDPGPLDTSKVVLGGASQGGADCFHYAIAHPAKTAAIGLWAGVASLLGVYDPPSAGAYGATAGDVASLQPVIAACWGVASGAPLPAGADPMTRAADIACPVMLCYSQADTTVVPATQTDMAAALPHPDTTAVKVSETEPHAGYIASEAIPYVVPWMLDHAAG